MNNKKAVSAVVATVLIILITVAAITIIWAAVIPMIRDNLEGATTCSDATTDLQIVTSGGYTCLLDADANGDMEPSVQVRRGSKDYTLVSLDILLTVDGDTTTTNQATTPGPNEEMTYDVADGELAEVSGNIESVRIAPVIRIGNEEVTCDPSSTVTLTACA